MLPECMYDYVLQRAVNTDMDGFPLAHKTAMRRYYVNVLKLGGSDTEKGLLSSFKFGAYPLHPLTE